MRIASRLLATAVMAAGIAVTGASAALAVDCAYVPTACEEPSAPPATSETRLDSEVNARTTPSGSTLPFTGGEIALGALLGAGAVGTGAALVAAARRRPGLTG